MPSKPHPEQSGCIHPWRKMFGLSKKTILLLVVALIVGARYRTQIATLPVVGSLV